MADERDYFHILTEILRENGFEWVVAHAQAEISEGRAVPKEVSAPSIQMKEDPDTFVRQAPRRRRARLVASEPFSAAEQLEILVSNIEAAIVTRAALEKEILSKNDQFERIEFLPEDTDGAATADDVRSHYVDNSRIDAAEGVWRSLSETLGELRGINDAGT